MKSARFLAAARHQSCSLSKAPSPDMLLQFRQGKRETCDGFVGSDERSVLLEMARAQEICCLVGTCEAGLIFSSAMEVTVPAQPWETFQRPYFPLNAM